MKMLDRLELDESLRRLATLMRSKKLFEILQLFNVKQRLTTEEVVRITEWKYRSVRKYLLLLHSLGLIKRVGSSEFQLNS